MVGLGTADRLVGLGPWLGLRPWLGLGSRLGLGLALAFEFLASGIARVAGLPDLQRSRPPGTMVIVVPRFRSDEMLAARSVIIKVVDQHDFAANRWVSL